MTTPQGATDRGPADGEQFGGIVDAVIAGAVHAPELGLSLRGELGPFAAQLAPVRRSGAMSSKPC